MTVASRVHDGGAVDDPDELLSNGAAPAATAARSLVTFARIPRKASVASSGFDPTTMIGQRRAMVAGGPPPPEPILERIGLTVLDAPAGVIELHRSEYVRNSFGAINGGVLGLVFQGAAEAALPGHVATDLQIHYLAAGEGGPGPDDRRGPPLVRRTCDLRGRGTRRGPRRRVLLAVATVGLGRRGISI